MRDYKKGKIYAIRCFNDKTFIYVGSTACSLCERWKGHRYNWKSGNHLPFHRLIQDINDWYIELYEHYACYNNMELTTREQEVMKEIATLNKNSSSYFYLVLYFIPIVCHIPVI